MTHSLDDGFCKCKLKHNGNQMPHYANTSSALPMVIQKYQFWLIYKTIKNNLLLQHQTQSSEFLENSLVQNFQITNQKWIHMTQEIFIRSEGKQGFRKLFWYSKRRFSSLHLCWDHCSPYTLFTIIHSVSGLHIEDATWLSTDAIPRATYIHKFWGHVRNYLKYKKVKRRIKKFMYEKFVYKWNSKDIYQILFSYQQPSRALFELRQSMQDAQDWKSTYQLSQVTWWFLHAPWTV